MADKGARFAAAYRKAELAGLAACEAAIPRPMVVVEADALSGAPKPNAQRYYCSEGACGFAWVVVRPGTCSFARWLVKQKLALRAGPGGGGVQIWVSAGGQSVARKEAYAEAFAAVLKEELPELEGKVWADSRLD